MSWETVCFISGTVVVTRNDPNQSHFYIYPHDRLLDGSSSEEDRDRLRHSAAKELEQWLNGEVSKHPWLNAGERVGDSRAEFKDRGVTILATGPMRDPSGELNWVTLPSEDHLRKALIDRLFTPAQDRDMTDVLEGDQRLVTAYHDAVSGFTKDLLAATEQPIRFTSTNGTRIVASFHTISGEPVRDLQFRIKLVGMIRAADVKEPTDATRLITRNQLDCLHYRAAVGPDRRPGVKVYGFGGGACIDLIFIDSTHPWEQIS